MNHRVTLDYEEMTNVLAYVQHHEPNNLGLIDQLQRWFTCNTPTHTIYVTTYTNQPSSLIAAITASRTP